MASSTARHPSLHHNVIPLLAAACTAKNRTSARKSYNSAMLTHATPSRTAPPLRVQGVLLRRCLRATALTNALAQNSQDRSSWSSSGVFEAGLQGAIYGAGQQTDPLTATLQNSVSNADVAQTLSQVPSVDLSSRGSGYQAAPDNPVSILPANANQPSVISGPSDAQINQLLNSIPSASLAAANGFEVMNGLVYGGISSTTGNTQLLTNTITTNSIIGLGGGLASVIDAITPSASAETLPTTTNSDILPAQGIQLTSSATQLNSGVNHITQNGWEADFTTVGGQATDVAGTPNYIPQLLPQGASNVGAASITLTDNSVVSGFGYDLNGSRQYGYLAGTTGNGSSPGSSDAAVSPSETSQSQITVQNPIQSSPQNVPYSPPNMGQALLDLGVIGPLKGLANGASEMAVGAVKSLYQGAQIQAMTENGVSLADADRIASNSTKNWPSGQIFGLTGLQSLTSPAGEIFSPGVYMKGGKLAVGATKYAITSLAPNAERLAYNAVTNYVNQTGLVLNAAPRNIATGVNSALQTEVRNGYTYTLDQLNRATRIEGHLVSNSAQGRNSLAQLQAGGADRLLTDEGGHFVGRRFDGPLDDFNHFAQDMNFNRGAYKTLENSWQRALDNGSSVNFGITPNYLENSLRPHTIDITYTIDGVPYQKSFFNRSGGQ